MRSWMIVPAMDQGLCAEAAQSDADVVAVDLRNSSLESLTANAKHMAALSRTSRDRGKLVYFVIPPIELPISLPLNEVVKLASDGVFLAGVGSGADLQKLDAMIAAQEALAGIAVGAIRIAAMCGDTPESLLDARSFIGKSRRLSALAWSAPELATRLGIRSPHSDNGAFAAPLQMARSTMLFAARAARTMAIDTAAATRNLATFERQCIDARAQGFDGKIAVSVDQVRIINTVFGSLG